MADFSMEMRGKSNSTKTPAFKLRQAFVPFGILQLEKKVVQNHAPEWEKVAYPVHLTTKSHDIAISRKTCS